MKFGDDIMMISPEVYYDMNLKNKDKGQIITAIRGLKQEIGRLKNILENTDFSIGLNADLLTMHPSYWTRIHWTREYLFKAKETLIEIGEEYKPSKKELKAISFDENIREIKKITFSIGGFSDGFKNYVIDIGDSIKATLDYKNEIKEIELISRYDEPFNLEDFYETIKYIYMGEWKRSYNNPDVLDGTQWKIEVYFSNKNKPVIFEGNNHYPYNFDSFLRIFEKE